MPVTTAIPYLYFDGNARDAIAHYEAALGAVVLARQTYGEVMGSCPEADRERVLHASLAVGEARLLLSDAPDQKPLPRGAQVQIAIEHDDLEAMTTSFAALAEGGGEITYPLHDAFWGARFGCLRDRFGVYWMFSHTYPKKP